MVAARGGAFLFSLAALRASAQGPNSRNGDNLPDGQVFTDEMKEDLFKHGHHKVEWVFALDFGECNTACGDLECAADMFEKVNSEHAFKAVLESIENAPGCDTYKVDTEYGAAPFIWEDEAQCWVSNVPSGSSCGQEPDPQFTDVRLCPCLKEDGKSVSSKATDALESSPADEDKALEMGKKDAMEGLHEVRSVPVLVERAPVSRAAASVIVAGALVGVSGFIGLSTLRARARRQEDSSRLLSVNTEDQEMQAGAPSNEF